MSASRVNGILLGLALVLLLLVFAWQWWPWREPEMTCLGSYIGQCPY